MLTHSRGMQQRYRGQTDAGSWTARTVARIGGAVVVAVLALELPRTTGATSSRSARACGRPVAPGGTGVGRARHAGTRSRPTGGSTIDAGDASSTPTTRQTTSPVSIDTATTVTSSPVVPARTSRPARIEQRPRSRTHIGPPAHSVSHHAVRHRAAGTNDLDPSRSAVVPARVAEGPAAPAGRRAPGERPVVATACCCCSARWRWRWWRSRASRCCGVCGGSSRDEASRVGGGAGGGRGVADGRVGGVGRHHHAALQVGQGTAQPCTAGGTRRRSV